MPWCKHCQKKRTTVRGDEGFICCSICGIVMDSDMFSSEVTFIKGAGGQSQASGSITRSVQSNYSESRERTLMKGRDEISYLVDTLGVAGGNSIIDQASLFYKIAVERNFTRGRRTQLVAASCLYIVCRENKKPFLLIDFSEQLGVNVYVVGVVFLQLCQLLRLEERPFVQKPVDPSLFIHRFTERLLGGRDVEVSRTALRILASMKRDWMQTGRKPSGLCGAALYISALSHGVKCSKLDIVSIVHVCENTLTKRLIEFESTESGSLTIEEFNVKIDQYEREANETVSMVAKSSATKELLCEHKGSEQPHFAHGLCRNCYDDFIEISGGLQGGSEPPAFQRAERERMAKSSAKDKMEESNTIDYEEELVVKPKQDVAENEKVDSQCPKNIDVDEQSIVHETVSGHSQGDADMNNMDNVGDESESLSDVDDAEVDGYLHNEEEKRFKKIIWEEMNKEYLEEQKIKQEAEDAARKAYEASFDNPEDLLAAVELAKSKKEKRRKKFAEAKNVTPAQNAAEAARQMLTKRKISSKINYDALDKLLNDTEAPLNNKKQRIEYNSDDGNEQLNEGENELASNLLDNGNDNEYGEGYNDGEIHNDDTYYGSEQGDYGYEDYGYED